MTRLPDGAWQVLVVVHGRVVRDACQPRLREAILGRIFTVLAARDAVLVDGWLVRARMRDGVSAVIAARSADAVAVPAYLDALVDAYAPPPAVSFVPPGSRGGQGGSGAPALLAAHTPPRSPN